MVHCPVCGMLVDERTAPRSEYKGHTYYFMNPVHKQMFDEDPEKFTKAVASRRGMQGLPGMDQ